MKHQSPTPPAARQPGGRQPAPPPLTLFQDFLNTRDRESATDMLDTPEALRHWLTEQGLGSSALLIAEREWEQTLKLRESLRALVLANNGGALSADTVSLLNALVQPYPWTVQFTPTGQGQFNVPGSGIPVLISHLMNALVTTQANGMWTRLKACQYDVCQWIFYDHSKSGHSTWCTMAICGSRVKMQSYRRRMATNQASQ